MSEYVMTEERVSVLISKMLEVVSTAVHANLKSIKEGRVDVAEVGVEKVLFDARAESLTALKGCVDGMGDYDVREALTVMLNESVQANVQNALYNIMMGADPVTGLMQKDVVEATEDVSELKITEA